MTCPHLHPAGPRGEGALEAGLDRALDVADGPARSGGGQELTCVVEHLLPEALALEDVVHESQFLGLLERERPPGRHLLDGPGLAEEAGEALRPAGPGQDAEIHLGKADLPRPLPGKAQVAGEGNLEAAADLGARPWRTFRSVVMPMIWPSVVAGSIFTFSLSLGDYITVQLVGGSSLMLGNAIYQNFSVSLPFAAALATSMPQSAQLK